MGGVNQVHFVVNHCGKIHKKILEVGSKYYDAAKSIPWKDNLEWEEYVGLDMQEGQGVDVVGDLEEGTCGLPENSFDFILCCSVLEHTKRPWKVAENLTKLLAPGGKLYLANPWVWRYHAYPDDYWRISFSGLKTIFPDLVFETMLYSAYKTGEFYKCEPDTDDKLCKFIDGRKYLSYLELHALGIKPR